MSGTFFRALMTLADGDPGKGFGRSDPEEPSTRGSPKIMPLRGRSSAHPAHLIKTVPQNFKWRRTATHLSRLKAKRVYEIGS